MTPKQIFLIVFAHRYIAALAFVVVAIAGGAYTWTTPKAYQATTDLLVDSRIDPIAGTAAGGGNYIATQIAILQSERVAIGVVKRLRIADTPSLVDQWKNATQGKVPLENYYANILRRGLLAEPLRGSNVIRLTFEGGDPKFVTGVVNTYARTSLPRPGHRFARGTRAPICRLVRRPPENPARQRGVFSGQTLRIPARKRHCGQRPAC